MVFYLDKLNTALKNFLRVCGYQELKNSKAKEINYARALQAGRFYPRFHIYFEEAGQQIKINLHLDAKQPSYEGTSAHSGEYEGEVVEKEAQRIKNLAERFIYESPLPTESLGFKKTKKPWWKRIFQQG